MSKDTGEVASPLRVVPFKPKGTSDLPTPDDALTAGAAIVAELRENGRTVDHVIVLIGSHRIVDGEKVMLLSWSCSDMSIYEVQGILATASHDYHNDAVDRAEGQG